MVRMINIYSIHYLNYNIYMGHCYRLNYPLREYSYCIHAMNQDNGTGQRMRDCRPRDTKGCKWAQDSSGVCSSPSFPQKKYVFSAMLGLHAWGLTLGTTGVAQQSPAVLVFSCSSFFMPTSMWAFFGLYCPCCLWGLL